MGWGVVLLGAYHGINPGMGWLFAVALGMQQRSARGVWRALPPIALGHGLAVGVVLFLGAVAGLVVSLRAVKIAVAFVLVSVGLYRLRWHRHPRFGGMQVGFRDLTIWSFLMASAHGAGFMVLPLVMGISSVEIDAIVPAHVHGVDAMAEAAGPLWTALGLHTAAYLIVTALLALIVYKWVGVAILRKVWFNLDWLWACVLVVTGIVVLLS